MNTTQMLATAAFAAMTALTPTAAHAQLVGQVIHPNPRTNSYVVAQEYYRSDSDTVRTGLRFNCTTGTITSFSQSSSAPNGGILLNSQLSAKAKAAMDANCNRKDLGLQMLY